MSRMLSKMNLISVVQQLSKEDIETIQGYVEMIEQENDVQKAMIENFVKENQKYKEVFNKLKEDLNLIIEYGDGEDASRYDKQYGEFAKNHLKCMDELLKEVK